MRLQLRSSHYIMAWALKLEARKLFIILLEWVSFSECWYECNVSATYNSKSKAPSGMFVIFFKFNSLTSPLNRSANLFKLPIAAAKSKLANRVGILCIKWDSANIDLYGMNLFNQFIYVWCELSELMSNSIGWSIISYNYRHSWLNII